MTFREARQRIETNSCRITRMSDGEYRVTHKAWRGMQVEDRAYYTDDLEDAVLTSAKLVP